MSILQQIPYFFEVKVSDVRYPSVQPLHVAILDIMVLLCSNGKIRYTKKFLIPFSITDKKVHSITINFAKK